MRKQILMSDKEIKYQNEP